MDTEIHGFRVRFEQRGVHTMILERKQGLARHDLSEVQIRMLYSGQVPHLLPVQLQETDLDVKLHYEIGQGRMLPYELKSRKLTPGDAILFLTTILNTLGRSTEYMLHEQRYFLHERLVFIRGDWGDVWLTYLPGTIEELPPLRAQLEKLLTLLIQTLEDSKQNTDVLRTLRSLCQNDDWSLSAMAKQVETMRLNAYLHLIGVQEKQEAASRHMASKVEVDQTDQSRGKAASSGPSVGSDLSIPSATHFHSEPNVSPMQLKSKTDSVQAKPQEEPAFIPLQDGWWEWVEEEEPRIQSRLSLQVSSKTAKWIIYILLAASLIVWLQTAVEPSQGWIYASVAMVFLLLMATLAVRQTLFANKPEESSPEAGASVKPKRDPVQSQVKTKATTRKTREAQPQRNPGAQLPLKQEAQPQSTPDMGPSSREGEQGLESYYDRLSANTTLLSGQDAMATTWLGNMVEQPEAQPKISTKKPRPSLELELNGQLEQVRIQQFPFLIGRDEENVHLTVQIPDISRVHAEICETPDGYAIRDLESRNGTTLNEQPLVPYESYPLSDRDVLGLVSIKVIFKTG